MSGDTLICPNCDLRSNLLIEVYRDVVATRACTGCGYSWLPAEDPPDAGGPYAVPDGPDESGGR
jgi:rubredoxin